MGLISTSLISKWHDRIGARSRYCWRQDEPGGSDTDEALRPVASAIVLAVLAIIFHVAGFASDVQPYF